MNDETHPVAPVGRMALYRAFIERVRIERGGRCEACGRTAEEAGERVLHVHHMWPIAKSGLHDGLAMAACNVLLLCDWCHALQHAGYRSYPWRDAGARRGRALA